MLLWFSEILYLEEGANILGNLDLGSVSSGSCKGLKLKEATYRTYAALGPRLWMLEDTCSRSAKTIGFFFIPLILFVNL